MTYLTDYIAHHAKTLGAQPAIITNDKTLSWRELHKRVEAAAVAVAEFAPLQGRQVVSLLLPNSWQFIVAYWGVVRSGNMAAPLDISFPTRDIAAILQQIPPKVIITTRALRPQLGKVTAPIIFVEELPASTREPLPALTVNPAKLEASLVFTSGTTGAPKAAPYTHANHKWNITSSSKLYNWTQADTLLLSLPFSHWHGLVMGLSGAAMNGNTAYVQQKFNARDTLTMLASGKISLFMHVSLAYMKLAIAEPNETFDLSPLRLCVSASAALPPSSWLAFKQRFGIEILECYGSSEAGRIASNTLNQRVPGSPGKAMPGAKLRVSAGGDIEVSSPGIFPGYYNNDQATHRDTTPDGWWRTGDLGVIDDTGRVTLKGRVQEKMKKHGYSIYPRDVEWALTLNNPKVREVYVLGVGEQHKPSDKLVYFVVGDMTAEQIADYSRQHMHRAWQPDRVVLLDAIPRTRSGKPVLKTLRQLAADALAA